MLRDNLLGLIEPMQISAGVDPLALTIQKQASDDRPSCLENPRPERAESSLTENVTSPFQAEPAQIPRSRIALETGTHSPWVSRQLTQLGHEVIVAHARNVRLIGESSRKDDQLDARTLARLARIDPGLLGPVRHRSAKAQIHLTVIRARAALVSTRTALVNAARGLTKSYGERLRKCGTEQMNREIAKGLSQELRDVLDPLLREIESLTERIAEYDGRIEQIAKEVYPQVARLKQVKGVGPLIALTYVLTLDDPHRFRRSRDVGCFIGLRPGRRNSGMSPNYTSAKKETVTSERCWYRGRTTYSGPLDRTAICGAGDGSYPSAEARMPRNEPSLRSRGSWPYCFTSCGSAERFTNHCGTTAKGWPQ